MAEILVRMYGEQVLPTTELFWLHEVLPFLELLGSRAHRISSGPVGKVMRSIDTIIAERGGEVKQGTYEDIGP